MEPYPRGHTANKPPLYKKDKKGSLGGPVQAEIPSGGAAIGHKQHMNIP